MTDKATSVPPSRAAEATTATNTPNMTYPPRIGASFLFDEETPHGRIRSRGMVVDIRQPDGSAVESDACDRVAIVVVLGQSVLHIVPIGCKLAERPMLPTDPWSSESSRVR
jgi:formylmethanofuran:tetrahydromethanopterin formyltransferase